MRPRAGFKKGLEEAQSMDRHRVRDRAAGQFDTDRIVGSINYRRKERVKRNGVSG